MKLSELVTTSKAVAETRSRLRKAECLTELLGRAAPDEIPWVASYLAGRLPRGRVGIGYGALAQLRRVRAAATPSLELAEVEALLVALEGIAGPGSNLRRAERLRHLFERATADEQQFLSRLLTGELRQGSLEGIMVEAVAKAAAVSAAGVRRALMLSGDLGCVARAAIVDGAAALERFQVELFRPVRPMLAQTAVDVRAALETLGKAALEVKLDGARIQVHKSGNEVRVFTRRLNDVSDACPEVAESVRALSAESVILDGEALALDGEGRPYPFQVTMRRFGRRLDVAALSRALPLTPFFFDCLFLDRESLIDRRETERFASLSEALPRELLVSRLVTDDADEAGTFLDEALAGGHEGVMVKDLDAPYVAGSRGKAWLKVKRVHTLDLVVLAAEWGSGRRKGWLSNLHLGALDPGTGKYVMLGKTFKGMTDEVLEWQTKRLQELEVERDEWTVLVHPELVVEIACDGLQKSPRYPGGVALRFARLKTYRSDKGPEDADTIDTVRALYRRQTGELPGEDEKQLSFPSLD